MHAPLAKFSLMRSLMSSAFQLAGAAVDLKFTTGQYYDGAPGADVTTLLSCSRASIGYAQTVAKTLTLFSTDTLRITDLGLLVENARTNVVLWNRDLTNAAWTASNITAAKNQTGPDGVSNSASSITASAGNGTILQAITLGSSARFQSAWVKRLTGSDTINMTMDNGSTWTAITVTPNWTKVEIPTQTLANPTVGFRIVTNGDAIAVDFVQNEDGDFASSPIPTTTAAATRAADNVTLIGALATAVTATEASIVGETGSVQTDQATHNQGFVFRGANSFIRFGDPGSDAGKIHLDDYNGANEIFATLGGSHTWGDASFKAGACWDAGNRSLVADAGTVVTSATGAGTFGTPAIGGGTATAQPFTYFRRFTAWNTRLADATLQGFTNP